MSIDVKQISDVRSKIQDVSDRLSAAIKAAHDEASAKIFEAVAMADMERSRLQIHLAQLSLAAGMSAAEGGAKPSSAPTSAMASSVVSARIPTYSDGRKSAPEIILELLAKTNDPVPSRDLNVAVLAYGLSKSAAEKAKTRLREEGTVKRLDGKFVVTEKGLERLRERVGSDARPPEALSAERFEAHPGSVENTQSRTSGGHEGGKDGKG